jgi:hypothetical protein
MREKGVGEEERGEDRERWEKKRVEKRCHLQAGPTYQMVQLNILARHVCETTRQNQLRGLSGWFRKVKGVRYPFF